MRDPRLPHYDGDVTVERATEADLPDGYIVRLALSQPLADNDYPIEMCSIYRTGPIQAIRWLVSSTGDEVLAISPEWEDGITCVGGEQ